MSATSRSCRIRSSSPKTCCTSSSTSAERPPLSAAHRFRDHELQSRPGVVDGADLDVDEPERQRDVTYHDIAEVGRNARALLRPGHPDHAVRRDRGAKAFELALEPCRFGRKQMDHVERRRQARRNARAGRYPADDLAMGRRRAADKNAKARLDAELLRE